MARLDVMTRWMCLLGGCDGSNGQGGPSPLTATIASCFQYYSPRLILCSDVLKNDLIIIYIDKQFFTAFTTILFVIFGRQTRQKFCTDMLHLKLFRLTLMAKSSDSAHVASNSSKMWKVMGAQDFLTVLCSGFFKMLKPLVAQRTTHTVLPVCFLKNTVMSLQNILLSLQEHFTHTYCSSSSLVFATSNPTNSMCMCSVHWLDLTVKQGKLQTVASK